MRGEVHWNFCCKNKGLARSFLQRKKLWRKITRRGGADSGAGVEKGREEQEITSYFSEAKEGARRREAILLTSWKGGRGGERTR